MASFLKNSNWIFSRAHAEKGRLTWLRGAGVALAVASVGCTATSQYMLQASLPVDTAAPPNASVVVFVRHSHYGASVATTILDDRGMFMGDSIAGTEFAVVVPPGPHLFLSWAENTAPLSATLLPGRVYYVEVAPRLGFWSPRVQLFAITPRSDNWQNLRTWIGESTQLVPDSPAGQGYLNARRDDVAERIRRARERLSELDKDELDARTLYPEDGIPSAPPAPPPSAEPRLPPPPPAPPSSSVSAP
jgi:hypothetical protein